MDADLTAVAQEERTIMAVLTQRGHYREDPEDFEWANADAVNIHRRHITMRGLSPDVIREGIYDTGLHVEDDDGSIDDPDCLKGDVAAIHDALTAAPSTPELTNDPFSAWQQPDRPAPDLGR